MLKIPSRPRIRVKDRGDGLYGRLQGIQCGDGGTIGTNYTSASCEHDTLCVFCTLSRGQRHEGCKIETCRAKRDEIARVRAYQAEEKRKAKAVRTIERKLTRAVHSHMRDAHHGRSQDAGVGIHDVAFHSGMELGEWYYHLSFCGLCGHLFTVKSAEDTPPKPRVVWFNGLVMSLHPDIFFGNEACRVCKGRMIVKKKGWHYHALGPAYELHHKYPFSNTNFNIHYECGKILPSVPPQGTEQDYPYSCSWKAKQGEKGPQYPEGLIVGRMVLKKGIWQNRTTRP